MNNHFIKNIEIKNFKCFKDFKAEGFGRVNLIGGKNNVGKTAFMEACYLATSSDISEIYLNIFRIKTLRNMINKIIENSSKQKELNDIIINNDFKVNSNFGNNSITTLDFKYEIIARNKKSEITFDELSSLIQIKTNGLLSYALSAKFIFPLLITDTFLMHILGNLKLNNKYEIFLEYLNELFSIESIDKINDILYIKKDSKYRPLYEYGHGLKSSIYILSVLLFSYNNSIFLDELENGIHYTNLDKLWEIILKISKQQNVQVFATTHSKECIESYARVAKELEDNEITFIKMTRLEDGSIMAGVRDYDMLQYTMRDGHEVRGV